MTKPLVSIVIPCYKDNLKMQHTLEMLFTLKAKTAYPNYEVIIINSEGSFAENCNRGIAAARGEFICLFNDDLFVVQDDWLDKLVDLMESNPKCGAVSPRMLFPNKTIQFGGMIFHGDEGRKYEAGHLGWGWPHDDPRQIAGPWEFQATTFGCVLLRKHALDSLIYRSNRENMQGFFTRAFSKTIELEKFLDENYKVGGFEDVDACFRMKLAGWQIWYEPRATILHHESATFNAMDQGKRGEAFLHNRKLYHQKWDKYFGDICPSCNLVLLDVEQRENKCANCSYRMGIVFKVDDKDYEGGV